MMISFKKIYSKAVVTAGLLMAGTALTSCDSYLSEEPKSQITPEEAYSTAKGLKNNALLTIYNYIGGHEQSQGLQGTDRGVYDLNSFTTDEQIIPVRGSDWYDGGLWFRLFYHDWTPGEGPFKNTWDYLYKVVMLCNEGIERIDAFNTTDPAERKAVKEYKSELRAVRAMYYFYLMDLYGRLPLVTSTSTKSSEMTLTDRKALFYWIYNEFNEAMPDLAPTWSQFPNSEYYGRMTVFVAYFVMMKLAINAEIYTDNEWTDQNYPDGKNIMLRTFNYFGNETKEANAWETVRDIYNIIKAYYSLSDYYSDNFDVSNETSKENIFVIPMNPILYPNKYNYFFRSRHYCHGAALNGGAENGPCATISTVETFGYNGSDNHMVDARFDANFYYGEVYAKNELVFEDDGVTPLVYHPLDVVDFDLTGYDYEKTAGARIAKYSIDATARDDGRLGNNDIVLFRFADAVLMYAEASYRVGDMGNALEALNHVYKRSNYGIYSKPYTTITDKILLDERLMEFMWEGWRRNDLIRFRKFNQPYDLKDDASEEEDAHTIVFPIPADMLVMHPDWKQNPGY